MSLLVLDHVTKRLRHGRSEVAVLQDVSMEIAVGELVAVRGARRSGRSTLLQVATGLLAPDAGSVLFAGRDVADVALGRDIAWAAPVFDAAMGRTIAEQVGFPDATTSEAKRMLDTMGAADLAGLRPRQCRHDELLIACIARAMVRSPRLLVLDVPVTGLNTVIAERVMELLRAIALGGTAVLFTEDEAMLGVDRTLIIDQGRVRGVTSPASAEVIPIRGGASA